VSFPISEREEPTQTPSELATHANTNAPLTAQRFINHLMTDGKQRIRIELPEMFDLRSVLDRLEKVKSRYNIRVYQGQMPMYTLDLDRCYDYLLGINNKLPGDSHELRDFIDNTLLDKRIVKKGAWRQCVHDYNPKADQLVTAAAPKEKSALGDTLGLTN
jgi:hypothetical protein